MNNIFAYLVSMSRFRLLALSVAASEVLSAVIVCGMSILLNGVIRPDYLATGAVTALIVSAIIVSLILHLGDQIRKGEERYRKLYTHTPAMLHSIDAEGRLVSVSEEWLGKLGYSREEVLGRRSTAFLTEASRRYASEVVLPEFYRTGSCRNVPYQMVAKNCRILDVLLSATSERDDAGKVIRSLAVIEDITERTQLERVLRENEEKYRFLVDATNTGYVIIDGEGKVADANATYVRFTGHERLSEILGRQVMEWTAPCDLARNAAEVRKCVETGFVRNLVIDYIDRNGKTTPIEINANVMQDPAGPLIYAICRDISERRSLDEERLKAQRLESVGTLAGGIAHDFNNLLQGVFGYISLAKSPRSDRKRSLVMLDKAEKVLHRSVGLTNQLLTFSKGGAPVKKAVVLKPVIEDTVSLMLSGSRVTAELSLADDLKAVEADEGQIGQVIQNIVLNADHAMPLGGRIRVAARNVEGPSGPAVEIAISDQGIGIPPEHLSRIFDPYFTTKEKGSGLGLATSYSIVRNHGGGISVSSVLGKGTTFTIRLPATSAAVTAAAAPVPAPHARTGRILVMDDEEVVRTVAAELLADLGHQADFAGDGETAVRMYREAIDAERPYDAVILDLTIRGGMGGVETLRELKKLDPPVKAVVSSGYADNEVLSAYRKYGFRAMLNKPYRIDHLKEALGTVLA